MSEVRHGTSVQFRPGDIVQCYRSAGIPRDESSVPAAYAIGTVIDAEVQPHNRAKGCDMVVRLIDGRVGAARSVQWRLLPPPDEVAAVERREVVHG